MTFKRLTIQTKKSLSGLYSSSNDLASQIPEITPKATKTYTELNQSDLDEFGLPSSENASPARDSFSRRTRLLGSLRSIGSLRSLRTAQTQSKQPHTEGSTLEVEIPRTPARKMPSLVLGFEVSPPDKPMFDTVARHVSNSSTLEIVHSSPVTVSQPNKQQPERPPTPPSFSSFVVGHPPDSPAPIQRAPVQESILAASSLSAVETTTNTSPTGTRSLTVDPNPTPMPGTNLTLEDGVAPDNSIQYPSESSLLQDYFNIISVGYGSQVPNDSTLPSDQLSIHDRRFDEMVTGAATQTLPKGRRSIPTGSVNASVVNEKGALSSRKSGPDQRTVSQGSAATENLPSELAYLFWGSTTAASEGVEQQEHQSGAWSGYTKSPNSTRCGSAKLSVNARTLSSQKCADETCSAGERGMDKPLAVWDTEDLSDKTKNLDHEEVPSAEDDKEELHSIIRSYAGSMLYRSDAPEAQGIDFTSEFLAEEHAAMGELVNEEMRAEVELATRVMNRSLGG